MLRVHNTSIVNDFASFSDFYTSVSHPPHTLRHQTMSAISMSDDAPCGSCQALICGNDQALECDICGLWYHIACSGSSVQCPELNTNCEGLTWMCPICCAALRFAASKAKELDTENMALRLQLSGLHHEIKLLRGSLTSTTVLEPMAVPPTAPKQDSLHTNLFSHGEH